MYWPRESAFGPARGSSETAGESMTEKNGSKKPDDADVNHVVDELRNVLSGLNRPEPASEPVVPPPDFEGPLGEPDHPSSALPIPPSPHSPNGHAPSKSFDASQPSDAEFWKGNVLGWPPDATPDIPEPPPAPKRPSPVGPDSLDNGFLRDEPAEADFGALGEPMPEFGVEPDLPALPPKPAAPNAIVFEPILPDSAEAEPEPSWNKTPDAVEMIPSAPEAPKPVVPSANPWLRPEPGEPLVEPAMTERVEPDAGPVIERNQTPAVEIELPIPGTKEKKDNAPKAEATDLDLEGKDLKPKDLMQIACLFPEGDEKAGQAFVNRLRDSAEKLRKPMAIQAVFISAWSGDKVDVASWTASASLSGADVMFVLAPRSNVKMFRDLPAISREGVKTRLVTLEQTPFPTLYADILVEMRRPR
jgi:hypothetical protein